tara:strand:+ start:615 stop:782 length:168 start_codon:yes stop_codon:yes gene_type:complete
MVQDIPCLLMKRNISEKKVALKGSVQQQKEDLHITNLPSKKQFLLTKKLDTVSIE